jgi:spore coat polysaccharide biosynthesis protein SpsF
MKVIATIEARMTSTRLPGKPLLPAGNVSMLEHLVRRLESVPSIHEIVLATTINKADDALVECGNRLGISIFRGSENDVMQRVIDAADSVAAEIVVEITADCPIIDPGIIEQAIRTFYAHRVDYVSNVIMRSYPDGMDVQVFRLSTLKQSAKMTKDLLDREHVTLHIRNNPQIFKHIHLIAPPELHWPELGLTLDETNDYKLLLNIIEFLEKKDPLFSCLDVVRYLRIFPELVEINKGVIRKGNA